MFSVDEALSRDERRTSILVCDGVEIVRCLEMRRVRFSLCGSKGTFQRFQMSPFVIVRQSDRNHVGSVALGKGPRVSRFSLLTLGSLSGTFEPLAGSRERRTF